MMSASSVLSGSVFATLDEPSFDFETTFDCSLLVSCPRPGLFPMSTVYSSLSHLKELGLLTEEDLSLCEKASSDSSSSIDSLVDLLIDRGRLTRYQGSVITNRRTGWLKIGDYIIQDMLGKGGMGVVYKALDTRMHREVAIKMLLESGQQSEDKIERFRREAIAAARMNHPNIVTAYTANEHEGYPYLVMEYVKGRDLGSLVKKGDKLPVAEAVNYILQASVGMAYAHSRHIIHRDLKPSNLLLATPDDSDIRPGQFSRVKILDMGLARLTQPEGEVVSPALEGSDLSATGMLMGTVDYMAPEQAMDTKRADHRSDIYSLGCTLYYLLTKRPVYTGSNLLERISAHLKADIPSLKEARPEAPEELDAVFQKMVAKKPKDRYQSMVEVVEALQKIDRQLSGFNSSQSIWQRGGMPLDGSGYAQPGSSYGSKSGSGSGTQGSAPTIASGSGPVPGVAGSSYGSTAYAEEFPSGGTITEPGMPLTQKLIVVLLLGLMAGTMGAIYLKLREKPETIVEQVPTPVPDPVPIPVPLPDIYLPPHCQPVAESKLVEVIVGGKKHRVYDVIALDVSPLLLSGPAIAQKPGQEMMLSDPAVAQKPGVRFRLIPEHEKSPVPFYMMETKVWSDLFRAFAVTHPDKLAADTKWAKNEPGEKPVFHVNLHEAYAFAAWMGGQLPTVLEWDAAAGYYLAGEDRDDAPGPYKPPEKEGDPLLVAVGGVQSIQAVNDPTHDISPFKIKHMAGNGEEFTRTTESIDLDGDLHPIEPDSKVELRGWTWNQFDPDPLTYPEMELRAKTSQLSWGLSNRSSSERSFRVVLEIPGQEK